MTLTEKRKPKSPQNLIFILKQGNLEILGEKILLKFLT